MKLIYAPGACSVGIHVLLEELGRPYTIERLDLAQGAQRAPGFVAVNPKSKVPTLLRDDGSVLTEYGAISHYLAHGTALAAQGLEQEVRAVEAIDYIVGTIHMQGFTRIFRPGNFTPAEADHEAVRQRGREIAGQGFVVLAGLLGARQTVLPQYSHADCALFYVCRWAGSNAVALPPAIAGHLDRMRARPAVAAVLAAEGLR